jgi:myosin heavy chain 9/10/11/14
LERHLAAAQARYQDFEDVVLQLEREKDTHYRQLETTRKELESELKKRTQLERMVSTQKTELVKYKDSIVKLELELDKALSNLKAREWDIKQLEGRQDKTIVEHVHVLEEAKRVTDRQLAAAQAELLKNATYIRSLEKAKSRLAGEVEDLARQSQQDHMKSRTKQKTGKVQEPEILSSSAQSGKLYAQRKQNR